MTITTKILKVFTKQPDQQVARVVLNGYRIKNGGPLGMSGVMHSFRVVDGDLQEYWSGQIPLTLRNDQGQEVTVRIAALPADRDSYGLMEFLL